MKKFLVLALILAPFISMTDAAANDYLSDAPITFDYTAEEKVSFDTAPTPTPAPTGEKNIFDVKF